MTEDPPGGAEREREDAAAARDPRPPCPSCGSPKTQPFSHAGPAARVNMKCTACGHLFKATRSGR